MVRGEKKGHEPQFTAELQIQYFKAADSNLLISKLFDK